MAVDEEPFTFSWLALKLLGRNLYSNPWAALSELAANGLDAGAETVYVYMDTRNKANATIEVIDDGSGMSREDIKTYAKVGFNKREHQKAAGKPIDAKVKGRKGIGKLAALYLSNHFYLSTKHAEGASDWELDASPGTIKDDDHPALRVAEQTVPTPNDALWSSLEHGTRLTLVDVDLTGYGPAAISALGSRLANQFLLPESASPAIMLWVRSGDSDAATYAPVEKNVAFSNFVRILARIDGAEHAPSDLLRTPLPDVRLPARELPSGEYVVRQEVTPFAGTDVHPDVLSELREVVDLKSHTYKGQPYRLTGWVGVHATIVSEEAQKNDTRFEKNKFYNPAQLRIYVRDKLASDHLLGQLGLTGAYVNYIEGELSFDLLDDDKFDDIATSNRQDFDETDLRVTLLRGLVRPIISDLIAKRDGVATKLSQQVKDHKQRVVDVAKQQFAEQLDQDLSAFDDITPETRAEIQQVTTNKIEGDIAVKTAFRVFISHSKLDLPFARLIDEALRTRGARPDEIFFTSRPGDTVRVLDDRQLSLVIKECITSANTLVFYLTSKNFKDSEFCLFEGGAGWATRSVSQYRKLNMEFATIPAFLTDGRGEQSVIDNGAIDLTPTLHNYLVQGVLNPMIEHLNRGRKIAGEVLMAPFKVADIPTQVQLDAAGKTVHDHMDPGIVLQWRTLVEPEIDDYLAAYLAHGQLGTSP